MFAEPVCAPAFQGTKRKHTKPAPDDVLPLLHPSLTDPYVMTALATLAPKMPGRDRWQDTLDVICDNFIESLPDDDVDHALFALFECPVDVVAEEEGLPSTTYGALTMIEAESNRAYKTVERRFARLKIRIARVYLRQLLNDLRHWNQYAFQFHVYLLLDMLTDELRCIA